ncbi:MAG TPA: DUF6504 family protein [Bacillota bacterium]
MKEILDRWVEAGEWWDGDGPKEVFRVATDDGGVFELSREVEKRSSGPQDAKPAGLGANGEEWKLYKIYD